MSNPSLISLSSLPPDPFQPIESALINIEEGTEQWLFLTRHKTSADVKSSISVATKEFEVELDKWVDEGLDTPDATEVVGPIFTAIYALEDWGLTDAELLSITLGDKDDIPYFLRTVIFGILKPNVLQKEDNDMSEDALKFVIKFMLDFDEYTPGSKQAIEQLSKLIGHLDPNEAPLAATVKEVSSGEE